MIVISLNVYSGRPDPSWCLSSSQFEDFVEYLRTHSEPSEMTTDQFNKSRPVLGFRGFTLHNTNEGWLYYIHNSHVTYQESFSGIPSISKCRGVELFLKNMAPSEVLMAHPHAFAQIK